MKTGITRRKLIQGTALTAGAAAVFGPWKFNRVYAAATDKPILIGLT
ncbi:MAG: twin-arginine translocation signal domain-containing protein, partial [Alphaproteobacteria bacterium]|nr:twin-arginine translocation signal domain-containing protein [Alphaproteobacteria bacterium]